MVEVRPRESYGPVDRDGTGPLLLERLRHDFPDVTLFEPNVFYATERERAEYAFHLSARSWKDAASLRDDVARAERDRTIARDELAQLQGKYDLALQEIEELRAGRSGLGPRLRRALRR